ncbi:MAG: TlpA family protein disulfide reductase [Suipraeoptans sp.]
MNARTITTIVINLPLTKSVYKFILKAKERDPKGKGIQMKYKLLTILMIFVLIFSTITACSSSSDDLSSTDDTSSTETKNSESTEDNADSTGKIGVGDQLSLKDIKTTNLNGEAITGTDFAGEELTVLNIWGTWCPPCVQELPHLQEVSEEYKSKGVSVVGVLQDGIKNSLEPDNEVIENGKILLSEASATYTVILPEQSLVNTIITHMEYFPTTYFLDSDGNIIKEVIGSKDADGWRGEIDAALEELK